MRQKTIDNNEDTNWNTKLIEIIFFNTVFFKKMVKIIPKVAENDPIKRIIRKPKKSIVLNSSSKLP
jgi:regulator of extracellular matrix RemA (YlzA/DUF370 family)